jgi:hypothetical protein
MDWHTNPIERTTLQQLLDRLDPRLDEPCTVSGCSHTHNDWPGLHDVVVGVRAA